MKRKRKVNLSGTPSEHRAAAAQQVKHAQTSATLLRKVTSCPHRLNALIELESRLGRAGAEIRWIGLHEGKGSHHKLLSTFRKLGLEAGAETRNFVHDCLR